jgi:hypothetical protein
MLYSFIYYLLFAFILTIVYFHETLKRQKRVRIFETKLDISKAI